MSCTGAAGTPTAASLSSHAARVSVRSRSQQRIGERLTVRHPVGVGREPRVVGELRGAECLDQAAEESVVGGGDHQASLLGREDLVRRDRVERGSLSARHLAGLQRPQQVVRDERQRRLPERHVQRVPAAGVERGEDRERGVHAGRVVDEGDADADAASALLAGDADDPGGRLEERVVAGKGALRAGPAVGRDRAVDEVRVARAEGVRAQPELVGEARPQALDEHIGLAGEPLDDVPAAPQVERNRPLPRVGGDEERPEPVGERRSPPAGLVPPSAARS